MQPCYALKSVRLLMRFTVTVRDDVNPPTQFVEGIMQSTSHFYGLLSVLHLNSINNETEIRHMMSNYFSLAALARVGSRSLLASPLLNLVYASVLRLVTVRHWAMAYAALCILAVHAACSKNWKTSGWGSLTEGRIACRAVIEDWMIPFAAYTAAETANAFERAEQPQNCPLSFGGSYPI